MPFFKLPAPRYTGPYCTVHEVAFYTPESWEGFQEVHCPLCREPEYDPDDLLYPDDPERRLQVARAITLHYGADIWADPEFAQMWRFYQKMIPALPTASVDFLAGKLCGVWTLRAMKRETNDKKALRKRLKESEEAMRRGLAPLDGPNLEPTIAGPKT